MSLLVDTSVWSLAFRRDPADDPAPAVEHLRQALARQVDVYSTGLVLQEVLQGFIGPKNRDAILAAFASVLWIDPDRADYLAAADLRNQCRQNGIQLGTIDALLVQLCLRHDLTMLSTDRDFENAAGVLPLRVWSPPER